MQLTLPRVRTWVLALVAVLFAFPALAAPTFPPLTGRVVDEAGILSPDAERDLSTTLENLETTTGRQLVVATVPSLQGYPIEDYGYQLGRTWGIGEKDKDTGAILLVAPNDRKVRIEVGYGLEPVLTDALSSVIIQSAILPKFRDGDMQGGILAGVDALVEQLSLPADQAKVRIEQASQPQSQHQKGPGSLITGILILMFIIFVFGGMLQSRRNRRGGLGSALPWIILGALNNSGRGGGGWSGGGGSDWGGGGGGFSGGGGSFGGGGSSGSW